LAKQERTWGVVAGASVWFKVGI